MIDMLLEFYIFNGCSGSYCSTEMYAVTFLVSCLLWALTLLLAYLALYPLIWERKYIEHKIKAEVWDKYHKVEAHSHYSAATKTTSTSYSDHYYLVFKEIDDLPFLNSTFKKEFSFDAFCDYRQGDKVNVTVKEKRRRFRFGSSTEHKYYSYEVLSVSHLN